MYIELEDYDPDQGTVRLRDGTIGEAADFAPDGVARVPQAAGEAYVDSDSYPRVVASDRSEPGSSETDTDTDSESDSSTHEDPNE